MPIPFTRSNRIFVLRCGLTGDAEKQKTVLMAGFFVSGVWGFVLKSHDG